MKRLLATLLCLALLLSMLPAVSAQGASEVTSTEPWDGRSSEPFAGGSGTEEDPYLISNGAQLYYLALIGSDGTVVAGYYTATKDQYYALTKDIDLGNKTFPGIEFFSGTLDGNGYKIYNLNIKNTKSNCTGLIREASYCTIRNLTIEGTVVGNYLTGAMIGLIQYKSTIENCTNLCDVTGTEKVGGICGFSNKGVEFVFCKNLGNISGKMYVGGILGESAYSISVVACFNTGKISASEDSKYVAGILGHNVSGSVNSCVNAGEISGINMVAGIVGYAEETEITNCYNLWNIYSSEDRGGPCGIAQINDSSAEVTCCYNIGALHNEQGWAPYEIASNRKYAVEHCYYLAGVNLKSYTDGSVALTEEEMSSVGSFIGFDFINTWTWDSTGAYNYPILREIGLILPPCAEDAHIWDDGVEKVAPTCTAEGEQLITCTKCKKTMSQPIPALGHIEVADPEIPAECTESGLTQGSHCDRCGEVLIPQEVIQATGHSYEYSTVAPNCTEQGYDSYACSVCGHSYKDDYVAATGHSYTSVITAPTCLKDGYTTYTCDTCGHSYTGDAVAALGHSWDQGTETSAPTCTGKGEKVYTCLICGETKKEAIPENGHSYTSVATAPTCTETGFTTHTCTVCGHSYTDAPVDATGHSWDKGVIVTAPDCENSGKMKYTCLTCGGTREETIPATGHNYANKVTKPTCTEVGYTTHTCANCGDSFKDTYVGAMGHAWNQGIEATKATCTTPGEKIYTCGNCGETKSEIIAPLGHSYTAQITKPTCTETGYTTYTCSTCGHSYTADQVAALGHSYEAKITAPTCTKDGSTTYTCSACGDSYVDDAVKATGHNYTAKVTAPTCTEAGFTTYTCSACNYSYVANAVEATGHSFTDGSCSACGEGDPDYVPENPFVDVKEKDYFYTPVLWAVKKSITNGTTPTTFSPEKPCTRGQIVTFLWRACGSPEPKETKNPFEDVSANAYYYKAVLWAVEQGITTGVSKTKFAPDNTCTRGQVATFLWRSQGKPAPVNKDNPFSDVEEGQYYYDAVLWAVENQITQGTGKGKFSPDQDCTRGQIVTFLYRALGK